MNTIRKIDKDSLSQLKQSIYYGIDLGTTFTVVAQVDLSDYNMGDSELPVKLINIEQHSPLDMDGSDKSEMMASILAVNSEGSMFVGNKLYRLKGLTDFRKDQNIFYHWKLDLGISIKPLYKQAVREDLNDASKVAGKILNYARIQKIGKDKNWKNVIITVPASFQANQRLDVQKAIRYANIEATDNQLIDEPNAALLGYLNQLDNEHKMEMLHKGDKLLLVVDFGGGTCDLSLIRLQLSTKLELQISNLAISRYNDLGGQDIDMMIAESSLLPQFMKQFSSTEFDESLIEHELLPQLAVAAEKLKIDLSQTIASRFIELADIDERIVSKMKSALKTVEVKLKNNTYMLANVTLNGGDFLKTIRYLFVSKEHKLEIIDKVIQSMPSVIDDVLSKANVLRNQIDYILFAGGSVQNTLFVKETQELIPNAICLLPKRPDTLIAKGAAIYSFYKNGLNIELIKPIVSETIGVVTVNAAFFPLIKAGSVLPASFELPVFSVQSLAQKQIEIPFCISNEHTVVQTLQLKLPGFVTAENVIKICGNLSTDKLFTATVYLDDELLGEAEMLNPFVLANVSDENRALTLSLLELDKARSEGNTSSERRIILELIAEYYDISNYARCIALCNEFCSKFDPINSTVLNYLYCAYNNLGQRKKAGEAIQKAYKYHPDNSTIAYNMSIYIENEEGKQKALDFLLELSDALKRTHSILFRIALLQLHFNNKETAQQIAEDYKKGKLNAMSSFSKNLLKKVLNQVDIAYDAEEEPEKKSTFNQFNNKGLLRVRANVPANTN